MTGLMIAMVCGALAQDQPHTHAPHPSTRVEAPDAATLLWQGFEHTWERKALGIFAVPHRVSMFRSGPVEERHEHTSDGVITEAVWEFGQSTGVDGDHMSPVGYASRITAPDVQMDRGTVYFSTVDRTMNPEAPRALARFHELIRVPASNTIDGHAVGLVRGMSFRSRCMDDPDQCNSDGIWPFRFLVEIAPCSQVEAEWVCPVTVEVGRAWTPNRGGVKRIEEKPVNERMAIDIELDWVVLEGHESAVSSTTVLWEKALGNNRAVNPTEAELPIPVRGGDQYPHAAVGLSSFGFVFFPTGRRDDQIQRGRYVSAWGLRIREESYDPEAGVFVLGHSGGIRLPKTVRRTGVSVELGLTVVQLGNPFATAIELDPLHGQICSDSKGAPFFSAWKRCERKNLERRVEDSVNVKIGAAAQ